MPYRKMLGQAPLPSLEPEGERFQSGSLRIGQFFSSPHGSAAAKPDGTGEASSLYQLSFVDASPSSGGGALADVVFLSDRSKAYFSLPTQMNYLLGMGTRGESWRIQFNREEILPLEHKTPGGSRYWDVRAALTFEAGLPGGEEGPRIPHNLKIHSRAPHHNKLRGELGAGYFLHNQSFPARFDSTGRAFMRYDARATLSIGDGGLRLFAEADFLTDRWHKRYTPANLDLTAGIGLSSAHVGIEFTQESQQMLDRDGYAAYYLLKVLVPFTL
ncbi:MAG TPA: hypothetical protein DD417_13085 [Elusimicrobia bacterium]|nr:hypothetical protein [Elusimicrobiota bacterium]